MEVGINGVSIMKANNNESERGGRKMMIERKCDGVESADLVCLS